MGGYEAQQRPLHYRHSNKNNLQNYGIPQRISVSNSNVAAQAALQPVTRDSLEGYQQVNPSDDPALDTETTVLNLA